MSPHWPGHQLVHATQMGDSTLQGKTTQFSLEGTQQRQWADANDIFRKKDISARKNYISQKIKSHEQLKIILAASG